VADLTLADLMGSLHLHHPSYNNILLGPGPWKEKLSDSSLCLISALRYIHSQGIKHMDIKPQNVLIQRAAKLSDLEAWRFELFLCDFGISHIFEADLQSQTSSYFGRTPKYAAPEVASDDRHGRAADIFSMGCVLAEMTTVFNGFALLEFEDYRRGAVVISTNDSYGLSSEPYNQTIDRSQQWVARLQSMAIDTEMIISMLDKLPSRRPKLCNVSGDIDIGINRKILQRGL
jgi:serine/threonine protein kinase